MKDIVLMLQPQLVLLFREKYLMWTVNTDDPALAAFTSTTTFGIPVFVVAWIYYTCQYYEVRKREPLVSQVKQHISISQWPWQCIQCLVRYLGRKPMRYQLMPSDTQYAMGAVSSFPSTITCTFLIWTTKETSCLHSNAHVWLLWSPKFSQHHSWNSRFLSYFALETLSSMVMLWELNKYV